MTSAETPIAYGRSAPLLGERNEAILGEGLGLGLGLSPEALRELKARNVI